MNEMISEGNYLTDKPGIAVQLSQVQQQWKVLTTELRAQNDSANEAVAAWARQTQQAEQVRKVLDSLAIRAHERPDLTSLDADYLNRQSSLFKVRQRNFCTEIYDLSDQNQAYVAACTNEIMIKM